MVHAPQHRQKLIAAIAAHKAGLRHHFSQQLRKGTDVLVSLFMAAVVVDRPQIVQVKRAHRQTRSVRAGHRLLQNFFTFIFIRQSGGFVQINLALQNPVLSRIPQRLHQLKSQQKHQADDIRHHDFLQRAQDGRFSLRVRLRKARGLITDTEEMLTFLDDLRVLVALFPHQQDLRFQLLEIGIQLLHFLLKSAIIQPHQIQIFAAIAQSLNIRSDTFDQAVLRLSGILQLDDPLGAAPHQTGVVYYPGSTLNAAHHGHNAKK